MIKIYLRDNQKKWDEQLPEIQFAINTAVQESKGFSAAEMNFGRNLRPPKTFREEQGGQIENFKVNPESKMSHIKEILRIARRNLHQAQATQYNKKRRDWVPKINEIVYKKEFPQSKAAEGFAAKLAHRFSGPWKITSFISPTIVVVKSCSDQLKEKSCRVHLKDLKQINQEDFLE